MKNASTVKQVPKTDHVQIEKNLNITRSFSNTPIIEKDLNDVTEEVCIFYYLCDVL